MNIEGLPLHFQKKTSLDLRQHQVPIGNWNGMLFLTIAGAKAWVFHFQHPWSTYISHVPWLNLSTVEGMHGWKLGMHMNYHEFTIGISGDWNPSWGCKNAWNVSCTSSYNPIFSPSRKYNIIFMISVLLQNCFSSFFTHWLQYVSIMFNQCLLLVSGL